MRQIKNKIIGMCGALLLVAAALVPVGSAAATKDIYIAASDYGYGEYLVTLRGDGLDGVYDEDSVVFYYLPVYAEVTEENGSYYLDVQYDADDGSEDPDMTGAIAKVEVNIYDANGKEVPFSPITITPPTTRVELPFAEYGMESGDYKVVLKAYNRDGEQMGNEFTLTVTYDSGETPVPNTGGLTESMNISKTDYLITGLIIFGLVAIAGVMFIIRSDKCKESAKSRRRK